jgi:hypothetical protein
MHNNILDTLTSVILCCDIVRQVVVENETKKTVQQRQIDLLIHLRKHSFHQDIAFPLTGFPDVCQVVDALAPL